MIRLSANFFGLQFNNPLHPAFGNDKFFKKNILLKILKLI